MDEFKPEDDLKPDPSDRRAGRSRQSSDRESDPQINFDDVDLDADERRPARARKARDEREDEQDEEAYYESEEDEEEQEQPARRPRKRKKAPAKPASRQYIMMGVGILVLLLLIVGIGSALKAPSSSSEQASSDAKSIDISGNAADQSNGQAADQANGTQPAPGTAPANQTAANPQQDVSLPPISSTPTQGQNTAAPEGQQRVEVQGDLNNALTQQQGQIDSAVANSTLPTEPATVAPVRGGSTPRQATTNTAETAPAATTRPERKHAVIEPKPQSKPQATVKATEPKPVAAQPKRTETASTAAPVKTTAPATETAKPAATASATKPAATTAAPAATATAATAAGKETGDVGSLKSAPGSHYTLQLSSSSNYDNLNSWAKKENIQKYVLSLIHI